MRKKIIKLFLIIVSSFMMTNIFMSNSYALSDNKNSSEIIIEPKAIERYDKSVRIECYLYGSVTVDVTIGHNMTTGRMWVDDVNYTLWLNAGYPGVSIDNVYTVPGIDSTISSNKIYVYVDFSRGSSIYTSSGIIYL